MISLAFLASAGTSGQVLKSDLKPVDLYNSITQDPEVKENSGGESFAWHATFGGDLFVKAYLVWKDTAWLNWGVQYYEFLRTHMHAGPDGYIGLIGPHFYGNGLWNNEVISDALVANLILEFCELVLSDPALKKIYGKKAGEYVTFCKKPTYSLYLFQKFQKPEGKV